MQITLDIPEYRMEEGINFSWQQNFEITTKCQNNEIIILANKAGLISLAIQLLTLAQDKVPAGSHLHYDDDNSLENGSSNLIIQKNQSV